MEKKAIWGIMLTLLLMAVSTSMSNLYLVKATPGTIYIRADGSVEPPTAPIQRVGNVYTFTANIYDEIVVEKNDITIDGNGYNLQGSGSGNGFYLSQRNNVIIQNTTIKNFNIGVYLDNSGYVVGGPGITVYKNNITDNILDGVYLVNSGWDTISGNNITNNGYGIDLEHSRENTISGNIITYNNYQGINLVSGSEYNTISGNKITNNEMDGVHQHLASSHNTFSGNIIKNNDNGVYIIHAGSGYNTISGNIITDNRYDGIFFFVSKSNTVFGNNITNNAVGIGLQSTEDNTIYHNNFIDNTQQVKFWDSGYVNVWDDGYPSGGNYWSDYTGVDKKSGPGQDEPGKDGIGDTQYDIDEYNTDRYPLMNLWEYDVTIKAHCNTEDKDVSVYIDMDGSPTPYTTPHTFTGLISPHTFTVPQTDANEHPFREWSTGETSTTITVSTGGIYTAYYGEAPYDVTIQAYCRIQGTFVSVSIIMDGTPTGYTTPHAFTGLTGTHTFTVPNTDPSGHPFKKWSTGETSTTITVTSGGTYTAYYGEAPSVGGIAIPVDKLALLAPYIGLTSTIIAATVATAIYVKRIKRRKEKQ